MKNYTQTSRLCDLIIDRLMTMKLIATNPTNPDNIRESAYQNLVSAYHDLFFKD